MSGPVRTGCAWTRRLASRRAWTGWVRTSRARTGRVWTNRHAIGAAASQTRAPKPGTVTSEGGGFNPTLLLGGGAGSSVQAARRQEAGS